ncbi:MAG: FecR domain-containing protein [Bacteroidota bacterium]|nr:FecR domain-containing protein [Bacteroidota bacterium]
MKNSENIFRVVVGDAEAETKQSVLSNLDLEKDSKKEYNRLKNAWALLASEKEMPSYQVEKLYLNFRQQLNSRKRSFKLNANSFLKYAAIFILALGLSSLYFYYQNLDQISSNFQLFDTAVVAENGQRSKIILPDSTVVWLNSGTKITYNNNFGYNNREIKLIGQAFFQVTKNKEIPLVVHCNELKVKVLGTRFDVNAYSNNETISVALQSGSVELLHSKNEAFQYKLVPGEMAQYDIHSEKVVVNEVNVGRITAWTDGILYFNDIPMKEVLIQLERKYNIDIEVKNPKIYKSVFTATIKNETLEEIFRSIGYSCSVRCRIVRGEERDVKTKVIIN